MTLRSSELRIMSLTVSDIFSSLSPVRGLNERTPMCKGFVDGLTFIVYFELKISYSSTSNMK